MVPSEYYSLYSHSNVDSDTAANRLWLDPAAFMTGDYTRDVAYMTPLDTSATELVQEDFFVYPGAMSRIPAWSTSSIYVNIPVTRAITRTGCGQLASQYRLLEYSDTLDTPILRILSQHPDFLKQEETDTFVRSSLGYTTELYLKHPPVNTEVRTEDIYQRIFKIINAAGTLSNLYFLENEPEGLLAREGFVDWATYAGAQLVDTAVVPSSKDGWLPARSISSSMETTTLSSVAWGLLAAAAAKDLDRCVLILKQLVAQAQRSGWFQTTEPLLIEGVEPSFFGFDSLLSVFTKTTSSNGVKEVGSNACLGLALCNTLFLFSDLLPYGRYPLSGEYLDFPGLIRLLLGGLARFCAGSISPTTSLAAYKGEYNAYSYDSPSLSASFYVDTFLNRYLSLFDDPEVHRLYVNLHVVLSNLPFDLDNPYYGNTVEVEPTESQLAEHPSYAYDLATPIININQYGQKLIHCARLLWALYYADQDLARATVTFYTVLRDDLYAIYAEDDFPDFLFSYLCVVAYRIDPLLLGLVDSVDSSLYEDSWIPSWTAALLSYHAGDSVSAYPSIYSFVRYLSQQKYPLHVLLSLDLFAADAHAFSTSVLYELQRLMPYGTHWFSSRTVKEISSTVGSMLYAESTLYRGWYLSLQKSLRAVSPYESYGSAAEVWFSAFCGLPLYFSSLQRRRGMMAALNFYQHPTEDSQITDFCEFFFGILPTLSRLEVPFFNAYTSPLPKEDLVASYSAEESALKGFLKKHEYLSCTHKREGGAWVERAVPGLPRLTVPEGYNVVSEEEYFAGDFSKKPNLDVAIQYSLQDGDIYLLPSARYLYYFKLFLADTAPPNLVSTLRLLLPAGSYTRVSTESVFLGVDYV